jgi:hypothetical protein
MQECVNGRLRECGNAFIISMIKILNENYI